MNSQTSKIRFAVCIANKGYEDLDLCKVYRVLPDPDADEVGCLRVIDESGEDYLYPTNCFVILRVPNKVRAELLAATET